MPDPNAAALKVPVSDRDHTVGPADAPLTLVEYGDYECPHCGRVHEVVEELLRRHAGRLRFVFRHYPLVKLHPHARLAAEAAEAAAAQKGEAGFREMHLMLYAHQHELEPRHLQDYARRLGLDLARFERELVARAHGPRVTEDLAGGIRSGVHGTPAVFINGRRYVGSFDLNGLGQALEKP